jgi:hypothetical protein
MPLSQHRALFVLTLRRAINAPRDYFNPYWKSIAVPSFSVTANCVAQVNRVREPVVAGEKTPLQNQEVELPRGSV